MTSDKKNISLLTDLFVKSGLSNIVLSPGSRNAPIILSFANRKEINAFSIVDERSAAFFALGIALKTNSTVAIACTSGSAVLNYASAISEAYYQHIPLLVITADRPSYMVDVGDGQTIRQKDVFNNFINDSFQLPETIDNEDDFTYAESIINKALHCCTSPMPGPVHINIPFAEPIYGTTNDVISGKLENDFAIPLTTDVSAINTIIHSINSSKKVMIIAGQNRPDNELNVTLCELSKNSNIVIITETTSNLHCENFIDTIDNIVSTFSDKDAEVYRPEVVISFGGQVVSKMIKKYLRNNKPVYHWHVSTSGEAMDTYFSLTEPIRFDAIDFFDLLEIHRNDTVSNYSELWRNKKYKIDCKRNVFLKKIAYSDFKVMEFIINQLPENTILHLGNSTPVRYSQLFGSKKNIEYNSNRGVSGIDGQISTAAGYSYYSEKLNVLITGDLGFFYDSNGLMNNYLKPNLKIIVINNKGGGIFRFIPGPDTTPNLEEFFEAKHDWKAEFICKAFGVTYQKAETLNEIHNILPSFFSTTSGPTLIEIATPSNTSGEVLRDYFKYLKT